MKYSWANFVHGSIQSMHCMHKVSYMLAPSVSSVHTECTLPGIRWTLWQWANYEHTLHTLHVFCMHFEHTVHTMQTLRTRVHSSQKSVQGVHSVHTLHTLYEFDVHSEHTVTVHTIHTPCTPVHSSWKSVQSMLSVQSVWSKCTPYGGGSPAALALLDRPALPPWYCSAEWRPLRTRPLAQTARRRPGSQGKQNRDIWTCSSANQTITISCTILAYFEQFRDIWQLIETRSIWAMCTILMLILYIKLYTILSNVLNNNVLNFGQFVIQYWKQFWHIFVIILDFKLYWHCSKLCLKLFKK